MGVVRPCGKPNKDLEGFHQQVMLGQPCLFSVTFLVNGIGGWFLFFNKFIEK